VHGRRAERRSSATLWVFGHLFGKGASVNGPHLHYCTRSRK
jgi:hypothetical protein